MSRAAIFTQGDISKILKGAKAAGMKVSRVEIDPTGRIIARFDGDNAEEEPSAQWKAFLDAKKERASAKRN